MFFALLTPRISYAASVPVAIDSDGSDAAGTCPADGSPSSDPALQSVPKPDIFLTRKHRDPKCFVTAEVAAEKIQRGTALLVDVGAPATYAAFRFTNSINAPLQKVTTGLPFQGIPLLLIDSGQRFDHLEAACKTLQARGNYDVKVVSGGASALLGKLPTVGDLAGEKKLQVVSARDFLAELGYDRWTLIDVSPTSRGRNALATIGLEITPATPKSPSTKSLVSTIRIQSKSRPERTVVLIDEEGRLSSGLVHVLRAEGFNILALDGGWQGLRSILDEQLASWKHRQVSSLKKARCEDRT